MPTRSLPAQPSLAQLKLQARELHRAHHSRTLSAAARIAAHHPRMKSQTPLAVLDMPVVLADAQLVVAREYGFRNWADLKRYVEATHRLAAFEPHANFDEAVDALDRGDVEALRLLISEHPELVHARTNLDATHGYFAGATLLHHVAGNPDRGRLQGILPPLPENIVELTRLLLDAGADVEATTLGHNGGTTMGLVMTSKQASDSGVSGPLIDLLIEYGATLDLSSPAVLDGALANHAPLAAEKMIELGARPDVLAAAALGRVDLLRDFFDENGSLRHRPRRRGRILREEDAIGLALLFAYVNRHSEAVEFLLEKDGNWNMIGVNNGTAMHRAAWAGDLPMVQRLVAKGADMTNRENPFHSTPLSWAQHNKQHEVFRWMTEHGTIDLHDATCFDLRDHVEARLREDPVAVNKRIDQWEIPQSAPLHWAAWTHVEDVDGTHALDPVQRAGLVLLLLKNGADPNLVAGNGLTALDIALASDAPAVAALLREHGAKRAADL